MKYAINVGDKVWMLIMPPLTPVGVGVFEGKVVSIGKSKGDTAYNCTSATGMQSLLLDRSQLRPLTNYGRAELLRMYVHYLNAEGHKLREKGTVYLDEAGVIVNEICELERRTSDNATSSRR